MKHKNRSKFENLNDVYFVTTTVIGYIKIFNDRNYINIIIDNLNFYQSRGDFVLIAYVIMPNHIHLLLKTMNSQSISGIMANFKRMTSRQISQKLAGDRNLGLIAILEEKAELEPDKCRIWKPRFDCMTILNEKLLIQKIRYIHQNPVRAGLALDSRRWIYSSASIYSGYGDSPVPVDFKWKCFGYGG